MENCLPSGAIASVAVAVPPLQADQRRVKEALVQRYAPALRPGSLEIMNRVFDHPSVTRRHFAIDDLDTFWEESPDVRVARFTRWAVNLGSQALQAVLRQNHFPPEKIFALVVNTCTGYLCPGLSTYLIDELHLNRNLRAYDLVGSGCSGAIPNLQMCQSLLPQAGEEEAVLCLSVEICTATMQMGNDTSLLISNALFADGAGAALIWNRPQGLRLVASAGCFAPEFREDIRFVHKQGQLHNQLSSRLPSLIGRVMAEPVGRLLAEHNLKVQDIRHWAIHPGGHKIIEAVKDKLGLTEDQVRPTREILRQYGNLSSASVWFVIQQLWETGIRPGEWCLMLSYGAGMSVQAFLLKAV
jgi:alkylresorcinol/alkylpyrone synthase